MQQYLIAHAAQMGISLSPEQAEEFCRYHFLLTEANKVMNLTRVSEEISEACDRNYLDSLTLLPYLEGVTTLVDVGSGAGFPGIPLAIMRRDIKITLLDSLGKRVDFLNSVIKDLGLNAEAVHIRCEDAAKLPRYRDAFDVATARAVAELNVLSEWLLPFVKVGGRMLALKGLSASEEMQNAQNAIKELGGSPIGVHAAQIPGRDWQHALVEIKKIKPTPKKYPRKAGTAQKTPIV